MINYSVVMYREGNNVGLAADNIEVLEDTETQVVLNATFDITPEVEDILEEANAISKGGVGAATGHVVKHEGDILGTDPDQ